MSATCDRSVVFSGYSSFLHQYNWLPPYNWNIVESGIKHHNPNPYYRSKLNFHETYIIISHFYSFKRYFIQSILPLNVCNDGPFMQKKTKKTITCTCNVFFLAHLTQRVMWAIVTTEYLSSVRPLTFHILINSSEATGPIWTKLWWNGPWMAPFQNCVRWSRLPAKMAAKLKIEKRGDDCSLLL